MISLCEDNSIIGFELFQKFKSVLTNFVTTRHGGYSTGTYESFNCSPYSGDDYDTVNRNLDKLCCQLPQYPDRIIRPRQTHGIELRVIDKHFLNLSNTLQGQLLTQVDALVTQQPGCCVCVSTADCIPVLLYDSHHQVVAAIHAGWRGTVKRIVKYTLHQMSILYGTKAQDVYAAVGPGISMDSFEVGEEVYVAFQKEAFDMQSISNFDQSTHKFHINLFEANIQMLQNFGVPNSQIQNSEICTYISYNDFFSARRLGKNCGRILTGIMINKK